MLNVSYDFLSLVAGERGMFLTGPSYVILHTLFISLIIVLMFSNIKFKTTYVKRIRGIF